MRKTLILVVLAVGALTLPASASETPKITKSEARYVARTMARDNLAMILSPRLNGYGHTQVTRCRVAGSNGTCYIHVWGTARCRARVRIRKLPTGDFLAWAARLRCR